ncbi:unnamed protein product [Closterium sp. Naga37s-1]|nr:unnamed protein product [Closterium sp. Naga37s-1]
MGVPVKRQLVVVPLILSLILGSSSAHAWRRALLSETKASPSDDAVSWTATSTNGPNAPRELLEKAHVLAKSVPNSLVISGAATATPAPAPAPASEDTTDGAPSAPHNPANGGAAGSGNAKPRGPGKKRGGKGGAIGAAFNVASAKKGNAFVIPGFNLKGRKRGGRGGKGKSKGNKQRGGSGDTNGANPGEDGGADGGIEGEESGDNEAGDDNGGDNGGDNNSDDSSNGCPDGGDTGGNDDDGGSGSIDIATILEEHNKARQEVGVPDLAWDDAVAASAAEWASELVSLGCPLEHGGAEGLGQNLYWLSPAALTPEEDRGAVQSWVEEKADWTPSPIPDGCADGKMCGHYTQVVWRDTTHVGCASAQCPDGSGMWVCDYSPPGNFDGENPF